ncbi:MAG: DUF2911 domain-containing protein [Flammeovirgaceae bacterium]|nr:DUF2911 domain-containing protein [Flammeovirgaceae bacterium]
MFSVSLLAQDKKPMASPPATAQGTIDGVTVKVDYHQPSAKGRKIMGGLVPYDKVWRTGANASTSIEFSDNVKIQGKSLAKGKYALFTIPTEKEWTIIFNSSIKWGSMSYKESEDVLRVTTKPGKAEFTEMFTISVEGNTIVLKWENTSVAFAVASDK